LITEYKNIDFVRRKSHLGVINCSAVPQVDGDGYIIESEFLNIIDKIFSEEPLKAAAKNIAPGCVAQANEAAKGEQNTAPSTDLVLSILGRLQCIRTEWVLIYFVGYKWQ
jgi:hypothetical protein